MANLVDKSFTANGTWVAPAEVFNVKVIGVQNLIPFGSYGTSAYMLATDGNVYAWGLNAGGELGVGDVTLRSSPVIVLNSFILDLLQLNTTPLLSQGSGIPWAQNSSGDTFSWGPNSNGQLGTGDVTPRSSPVVVIGGLKFSSIIPAANGLAVFGITQTGVVYGWGSNPSGNLGVGDVVPRSSPVIVLGGLNFQQLVISTNAAINGLSVCGLTTAGAAYCWGVNTNGDLGVGDVTARSSPVLVLGGLTFVKVFGNSISSSGVGLYFFGLTAAGALYAWGDNSQGQLGVGDTVPRSSPVLVLGGQTWKTLSTNNLSVIALNTAGAAYAWGNNGGVSGTGVLGVGDVISRSSPVAVLGGLTFASAQVNINNAFALTSAGAAYAWGNNGAATLGIGNLTAQSSPIAVLGGIAFAALYPNIEESVIYGISTLGQVYSWGNNTSGNLGQGPVAVGGVSSPVLVLGGHYVAMTPAQVIKEFQVVPGTSYAITLQNPICYFGSNAIGPMLNQITLQYQQ